jgi:DNA polymerase III delta prime subunit
MQNTVYLGDRSVVWEKVLEETKTKVSDFEFFEVQKLNISVDDIRRMISFVNRTSEKPKVVFLSSFYWGDEAQNAMLKVLEESPANTTIYLFGNSEKVFLKTILSRVQKIKFEGTNRYKKAAQEVLELEPNDRPDNKHVKKVLALKTVDYNFEKNTENEKKDREAHILFLQALMDRVLEKKEDAKISKNFLEKILHISTVSEIEGGSPHLFIDWLLLSAPKIA